MDNITYWTDQHGTRHYHRVGDQPYIRHRTDGPAVEHADGTGTWWLNGLMHREAGPAVYDKGKEMWFYAGLLHRNDGPAVIWYGDSNTYEFWWHGESHGLYEEEERDIAQIHWLVRQLKEPCDPNPPTFHDVIDDFR
jgi:hypothetical protein